MALKTSRRNFRLDVINYIVVRRGRRGRRATRVIFGFGDVERESGDGMAVVARTKMPRKKKLCR
jgi:hypothetical protein